MAVRDHYALGQFCWVDLTSRDMAESRQFYQRLFRWQSVDRGPESDAPYCHFQLQGMTVAGLGQMSQELVRKRVSATWNSYIHVEDIQAACAQATELGGTVTVPVTKVEEAGWLAFIRDPTGAQVGLWQKDQHFGAELHQDFHCFCWNELCTRNIDQAAEFFTQMFGWEYAEYPSQVGKYYVVRHRGEECSGLLQMDQRWGEMPPNWLIYFAVRNVDITVDQVRQLGGYVLVHPFDIEEGRLAVVADNQGAMFDLVQMNDAPAS